MIEPNLRQTIISLHERGESHRRIGRLLKISKTTVRRVIAEGVKRKVREKQKYVELIPIVKTLFLRAQGNLVRVLELLKSEYGHEIAYSTLTRLVREQELRGPKRRVGTYIFEPGEEMQHDTSPHLVMLDNKEVRLQCACLVFSYSRRMFMQYYTRFTRFECKTFLKDALTFMGGSCEFCVVDNTSVILASGSGADAIIAPEMATFGRLFGFKFKAHQVLHPDRKAYVERNFHFIENNFLAARTFFDLEHLNGQALDWCIHVANHKEKRSLGKSPECAYIQEKPYLKLLPQVLPPIYEHCQRTVDSQGFINFETNRYSVPERFIDKILDVYKYLKEVRIFDRQKEIAIHRRLIGQQDGRHVLKGHHTKQELRKRHEAIATAERQLIEGDILLTNYVKELKMRVPGRGLRALSRLLHLKRTYPKEAVIAAVTQALHYGLYDLNRLEALIIECVAGHYFNLPEEDHHD